MFKIVSKTNPKDVKTVYHIIVNKGASRHFKFVIFDEEDEEWTTVSSANYRPLPPIEVPFIKSLSECITPPPCGCNCCDEGK